MKKVKIDIIKFLLNMNLVFTNKKEQTTQSLETSKKIGRNDKCYCGSNNKYKKCCLNATRRK